MTKEAELAKRVAELEKELGIRKLSAAEKLANIENLSHTELKSGKADLLAEIMTMPIEQLGPRYLQARTDAKQRDERMAGMGQEITDLQEEVAAKVKLLEGYEARNGELESQLEAAAEELESVKAAAQTEILKLRAEVSDLEQTIEVLER